MARFCTQCGSPVGEGLSFCMNCGAKIAAPSSAPAASQPVAAGPAPMGPAGPPTPATAPAKKTSPVVKIVLVVVAFFVFITVAGIGACVYIGYRAKRAVEQTVKMDESGKSIKIQTPEGEIRLGEHPTKEGDTVGGVPIYTGATALEGGAQFSFGDKLRIGGQEYETSDSVDQVVDFYKEKLGPQMTVVERDGHYRMSVQRGEGRQASIVTIDVFADEGSGKTKITISHLGGME
jgi:hypothetical protein